MKNNNDIPAESQGKRDLKPDVAVKLRHLELLFGHEQSGKFDICYSDPKTGAPSQHETFDVGDIDRAAEFAAKVNAEPGVNAYVRPAVLGEDVAPFGAVTDEDFSHSTHVWCDFDDKEAALKARPLYSDCQPNFVVYTGRIKNYTEEDLRAHLYWRLNDEEGEVIRRGDSQRQLNKAIAGKLNSDRSVVNPTRMMRLAGSIAWPTKMAV